MTTEKLPTVQDVQIGVGKLGTWQWSYRLGNKLVMGGPGWSCKTRQDAVRAFQAHLQERGLPVTYQEFTATTKRKKATRLGTSPWRNALGSER